MAPVPHPLNLGGSFTLASQPAPRRLVVALDGLEKTGKTRWALTAPGPIAYQNLDIGLEGVIESFQSEKVIFRADYGLDIGKDDTQATIMAKAGPEWLRFVTDWKEFVIPAMKKGLVKTGVWDTGSELWELQRLARLGKLTQVMPHHYTALNSEYQNLLREVYDTPGNLVILHKLKPEWKDNPVTNKGNKTGLFERSGYSGTGFLVQVNATCWREKLQGDPPGAPTGPFHVTVRDCRQNATIAGMELVSGADSPFPADFATLAGLVYPESDPAEWSL